MIDAIKKLVQNNNFIFGLIMVFSAGFYLFNIGFSDLWSDETYTKAMIHGSLSEMFAKFSNDLHPPLYYLGLKLFTSAFGLSALSLRLFSVMAVLSILLLGYLTGQRVFGKRGAQYFCLMLLSVPMLAAYSHQARMYTWAAFSVTGVFLYSVLYLKSLQNRDMVFLFVFTLAAIYIHYYSMVAALVANMFVLLYLLKARNLKWKKHLLMLALALILFLPWLSMFVVQVEKVQRAFWAPEVNLAVILSCFTTPFTEQFWVTGYAYALMILIYSLTIFAAYRSFSKSFSESRLALWLSIFIFLGTIFVVIVVSLVLQPILYSRYIMAIVTMLVVPLTALLIGIKARLLRIGVIAVVLFFGIKVSISASYFSYGPYKQAIEYISEAYPDIHKVIHITEITAGPMLEYNRNPNLEQDWLKAKMSNVDAFSEIHQYNKPGDFLQVGEEFCMVQFRNLDLNKENLELVLSESERLRTDTVIDNKVEYGNGILIYLLRYKGENQK